MSKPPSPASQDQISQLQRREIQATVAACLIRAFAAELGQKEALRIAEAAIQSDARAAGQAAAAHLGANALPDLARVVREQWAAGEAISLRMLEENRQALRFEVTRCRYAEFYQAAGMLELGYCLSCSRDAAFARGFNPAIQMARGGTIMEGSAACDFEFTLDDAAPGETDSSGR